jgi:hypothetical protein
LEVSRLLWQSPFRASWGDQPILQALNILPGSEGKVIAVRLWAAQTRAAWGLRESEWAGIPVAERERMISGHKLADWLAALDMHKQAVEADG